MGLKAELMQQEWSWRNYENNNIESTKEYEDCSIKNISHYKRNKAAEMVSKDKEVREIENPYDKLIIRKCFRCNQLGHESNEYPMRKTVNIIEKNEKIIYEPDGDKEEKYEVDERQVYLIMQIMSTPKHKEQNQSH